MAPHLIELQIRGRGCRLYRSDDVMVTSRGGIAPPEQTSVGDLRPGDYVGIPYGGTRSPAPAALPVPATRPSYGTEKQITVPAEITDELAFLLGAYMSEGHTIRSNWSVMLTNSVEQVLVRAQQAWRSEFGINARITRQPGRCLGLVASSKRLVEFMDLLGCGSRAANKRVPHVIAVGRRDHALAFLQGVALDAYVTHTHAAKWAICLDSEAAIRDLQDLVTRLGIPNAQIPKYNSKYDKTYYELYAAGAHGQELCRLVSFPEPDKQRRAEEYLTKTFGPGASDVIPGIDGPTLYALIPAGYPGRNGRGTGRQGFRHLCDPRSTRVTRTSVERVASHGAELPTWIRTVLEERIRFAPVMATTSTSNIQLRNPG